MTGLRGSARTALWLCTTSIALGLAAAAAPAFAADDDGTVLPELVITAERRVQNLQEVPISATVLGAEQLAQEGVGKIEDIQRVSPSIAINTYNRSTFINIRGIGIAQSAPTSTPGVAYYLNGALIPHEQTIGTSFYDLETVQVLRGPQGTLTGQNSTGGAVYVTTPKPKFDKLSGYVDETMTSYSGSRTVGALNVPIRDWVAFRVAGVYDKRDSFTTNIGPSPSHPGDVNFGAIRVDLAVKPSDSASANFRFEMFRNHTDYNAVKRRGDVVSTDPFTIEEDAISNFQQEGYRAEIEARLALSDAVQLRADLNYQYGENEDLADGDRSTTAVITPGTGRLGFARTIFNTRIGELDLISTTDSPFQWVLGGFALEENVPVALLTYGRDLVAPVNPLGPTRITRTEALNRSKSLFGQGAYEFSPSWDIVFGARYSADRQTYNRISSLPVSTPTQGVAQSTNTTGRFAVNYHLNDATLIYGSVAKGYKAGGVNLGATDPPFEPEQNVVGEIGVKTTLLDGRLRINGDIFNSVYKNLQLSSLTAPPTATPPGTPTPHNVPRSISRGAEVEITGIFGNWEINAGAAYLNSETDSDAALSNNTGIGATFQTVPSGTGLPFSPRFTANAGIQYDLAIWGGTLTPRLQVSYLAEQYASVFQNANTLVPDRTLLDARVTFKSMGNWRAEAFVNNLADETYIASQIQDSSSTTGGILYGAPRVYGARLVFKFD